MKQLFLSFSSVSLGATVVASILTSMTVTCRTEKLVLTTGVVLGGCTLASGFALQDVIILLGELSPLLTHRALSGDKGRKFFIFHKSLMLRKY